MAGGMGSYISATNARRGNYSRKDVNWSDLKRGLELIRPFRHFLYVVGACMLVSNLLSMVMPFSIKILIDQVIPRSDMALLNLLALALVGFVIFQMLFEFVQRYTMVYTGERLVNNLRRRLHVHLQKQSLRYLEEMQAGGVISRAIGDVDSVRSLLFGGFVSFISNIMRFSMFFCVLLWINWRLTLISMLFMPFFVLTLVKFRKILRPKWYEVREGWGRVTGRVAEVFSGVKVVKTYNRERHEDKVFYGATNEILRISLGLQALHTIMGLVGTAVSSLGAVTLLWFGGYEVTRGALTLGELIAFHTMLAMMFQPMEQCVMIYTHVQRAMASIDRIFEVLDAEPEIDANEGGVELKRTAGDVVFEDVLFRYDVDAEEPTIDHVSFRIAPGETLALVGPSGAGKSTIVNLMARFYDIQGGCIRVDGHDIRDLKLNAYRRTLGIVLQETFLFKGTIRENISYGRPDASEEEVLDAARRANVLEFTEKLPDGLDAAVGERGTNFSGGQRQRVAIARAILTDPKILILDEATSSLDTHSESLIQEALEQLMKTRTTLVIAHRLSTITNADTIMVIDEGRFVEAGSHEALLHRKGQYYDMFMEQYGKVKVGAWIDEWADGLRREQAPASPVPSGRPARSEPPESRQHARAYGTAD